MEGRVMKFIAFVMLVFMHLPASALSPILFGPEFTFSPSRDGLGTLAVWERMRAHLIDGQPEGQKFTETAVESRRALASPNGWWLSTHWDAGSVEVQTRPMTVADFKRYKDDLNDAIFVSAANEAYFPELWRGGGHINIDLTVFKENLLLYRNFIVDLLNHNELFMGILNYDMHSANPHELLQFADTEFRGERFDIDYPLHLVDNGIRTDWTFERMTVQFQSFLTGKSFWFYKNYQNRLEIRAVRPQASIDIWIHQIELFEARIKYLATISTPIPYQARVPIVRNPYHDPYTPPIDPQEALRSFYIYVRESGLPWKDHRDYLWPQWMFRQQQNELSELEKFESSDWFVRQESQAGCERQLGVGT